VLARQKECPWEDTRHHSARGLGGPEREEARKAGAMREARLGPRYRNDNFAVVFDTFNDRRNGFFFYTWSWTKKQCCQQL
jgi:hypothetical protein